MSGVVTCKKCKHVVPEAQVCIWCGAPILYKRPKREDVERVLNKFPRPSKKKFEGMLRQVRLVENDSRLRK
jgi:hypothetical protein